MKKAVVTGPTGAIGIALTNELSDHGYKVFAVARPGSKRLERIPPEAETIICSPDEYLSLPGKIGETADLFFHLAWAGAAGVGRNDVELQYENIGFSLAAVKAAHLLGCKRFIGAGSQAEYGMADTKLSPSTPVHPETAYGVAKLCAGQLTAQLCGQLGIEHDWVRILSVYGPFDGENTMILSVIHRLLRGESPDLTPGEQLWDYLFSEDAAIALRLVAEKGRNNAVYCLGSGTEKPIREYVLEIREALGSEIPLNFGAVPYSDGQIMRLCADISDLRRDTGFAPKFDFSDGIKKTIEWYKTQSDQ